MKVKGLITYTLDQQIFKFKVNSGNYLELWGVNVDFKSNQNKWAIKQFYNMWVLFSNRESMCYDERKSQNTIFRIYSDLSR